MVEDVVTRAGRTASIAHGKFSELADGAADTHTAADSTRFTEIGTTVHHGKNAGAELTHNDHVPPVATSLAEGAEPVPDRGTSLVEHMDPIVDDIIRRYDPVLTQRIHDLLDANWTIDYGEPGSGRLTNHFTGLINVDGTARGRLGYTVRVLAHEVNHAHPDGYSPSDWPDEAETPDKVVEAVREALGPIGADEDLHEMKTRWTAANVWETFKYEADALMAEYSSRDRILSNEGPDIGRSYEGSLFTDVYDGYARDNMTLEKARERIGIMFGTAVGDFGDGRPGNSYLERYTMRFAEIWDHALGQSGSES